MCQNKDTTLCLPILPLYFILPKTLKAENILHNPLNASLGGNGLLVEDFIELVLLQNRPVPIMPA